jgi:hypothetical protein
VLNATTGAAGWRVIAVEADDLGNPDAIAIADGTLTLTDTNPDDDGFFASRFYVGTQLGCTSATSAQVQLQLTATSASPASGAESIAEMSLHRVEVVAQSQPGPEAHVSSISFDPISLDNPTRTIDGSIAVSFANAPSACGWLLTVTIDDFTSTFDTIPASQIGLASVSGVAVSASSIENGVIVIHVAGVGAGSISGTVVIDVNLAVTSVMPAPYATSVTVDAGVFP